MSRCRGEGCGGLLRGCRTDASVPRLSGRPMPPTATLELPRRRTRSLTLAALGVSALLVAPFAARPGVPAAAAAEPPPGSPGPTLAVEDTMHTEVPEVLVKAPRVTLDEILDRVARGEARRDSALHDMAFTLTFRFLHGSTGKDKPLEP